MTTPHHLGKYEITEVLGQGAMGVVYKGFDPGIRRTVAIKTIRRELIEGERAAAAMLARFRNEAQAAGKLAHPGIVAVYDYGEEASVAYIAMGPRAPLNRPRTSRPRVSARPPRSRRCGAGGGR